MRLHHFLFIAVLLFASCKKGEEITVPNNTAPPDNTISSQVYEDYVTRTYIRVLGREPLVAEMTNSLSILYQHSLSTADRTQFLEHIFTKPEYFTHTFNDQWINILNNQDTSDLSLWTFLFQLVLDDSSQMPVWSIARYEQDRLFVLQNTITGFNDGAISLLNLHKALVNNYLYDQINMGSANFVISVFQHYLYRVPTQQEQDAGAAMVDGNNAALFLQTGASKADFLTIFFNSNDYYEGQVVSVYQKYLYEQPTTVQLNEATVKYKNTNDYIQLQKDVLVSDKYVFGRD